MAIDDNSKNSHSTIKLPAINKDINLNINDNGVEISPIKKID